MWFVRKSEILSIIPEPELENILKYFSIHTQVKKNTHIYEENDPSEYVYLIKKGSVRLAKVTKDGLEITLSILDDGMIFGEGDVLSERTYSHFAETLEPCYICYIHKKNFKELLVKYDQLNSKILDILNKKWKEAQQQIEDLAFSDVKTRIVHTLINLSGKFGKAYDQGKGGGVLIDLELSQNQLADFVGTSRETVNRILNEMKDQGIIDQFGKKTILTKSFERQYLSGSVLTKSNEKTV